MLMKVVIGTGASVSISLGVASVAGAADVLVQPFLDFGALRDDNIELAPGSHPSTSGFVVAARLNIEHKTETSKTKFLGSSAWTNYNRADIEDKNEQGLFLNTEKRTSERGTLGLDSEYRRDALFESTTAQPGTGNVRDTDVGLSTRTEVRRSYLSAQPSWNWLLTERSAMRFAYRLTDVGFSHEVGTGLVGYREHFASVTYSRQLTAKDDFNLTTNLVRYEPDRANAEADTKQLLAGITRAFSEQVRGSIALGASRTNEQEPGREESSSGTVAVATLRQSHDYSTLEGVISSDVAPSGIGRSVRSDQIRVYWTRKVAPEIEFVLDAQLLRNRALEGTDPNIDRRYYEIAPQLRWHWLENVYIIGSFRHRQQKFDAQSNSADSNAVFLGVSYSL